MKYVGSKRRLWKYISPIILKNHTADTLYVEPFCGGCNSIDKVIGKRLASDNNHYLISLLKYMQEGGIFPEHISESTYKHVKNNKDLYPEWFVAFCGICCSFGARWFAGYARSSGKNFAQEGKRSLTKQAPNLKGIEFIACSYDELKIPNNSIVYCDPPYANTIKYKDDFDSERFWQWVRELSVRCEVYVSEYSAPDDFICIFEKEYIVNMASQRKNASPRIERLFTLR